ncbi:MAG: epimerase [Planctomycetes bacterium]|nr:epimerase [Planctomycetota bacterium]
MPRTYLVTGALGCIGAWVTKTLVDRGDHVVVADVGTDRHRLHAVIEADGLSRVTYDAVDITCSDEVRRAIDQSGASRVIHLAGLQVPACKADPAGGSMVNVVGTINVFQAAADSGCERVAYASSAAVYGTVDGDAPDESMPGTPETHYGVFKQANEGSARIFHSERDLDSVGIRPLTVYGVGRDQGLTSDPTRAMKAAVVGRPFAIGFSGTTDYQYVADTAAAFVTCVDRAAPGAHVYNLHGTSLHMADVVAMIRELRPSAQIGFAGPTIPIPPALDGASIRAAFPDLPSTPLDEGVRQTVDRFQLLSEEGRLQTHDLD